MSGIYIVVTICLLLVGALIFYFMRKKSNKNFSIMTINNDVEIEPENELLNIDLKCLKLKPVTLDIDENDLVAINNKELLSKIDNIIPNSTMAVSNFGFGQGLRKMSTNLLESDIPVSELVKSKVDPNAVRAMARNSKGIVKNANLTPAADKLNNVTKMANINAVMNVGAMVVGQYYMSEISNKLSDMQEGIDQIADFQDSDYKGRVLQVVSDTLETSEFSCDIIESESTRTIKLNSLEIDKKECKRLIGHANEAIKSLLKKDSKDYDSYIANTKEIAKWYKYQQMMLKILEQMALLDYTLNVGNANMEQTYCGFYKYLNMSNQVNGQVKLWHNKQQTKLKIKYDEGLRKREGIDKILNQVKILDKNRSYKEIDASTIKLIDSQISDGVKYIEDNRNLYKEDVKLIKKDDKYYFLPMKKNKELDE